MIRLGTLLGIRTQKKSGGGGVNPFADSPRTFVQSPQQVILDNGGTLYLFASNGDGGALKMSVGNATFYPNTAVAFFYYSWNGSAWAYVGLKTQGQTFGVTSFSYSTFNIVDAVGTTYFAANYP